MSLLGSTNRDGSTSCRDSNKLKMPCAKLGQNSSSLKLMPGGEGSVAYKRSWEKLLTNLITWSYSLDEVRCPTSRRVQLFFQSVSFLGESLILILSRIRNHTSNIRHGFRLGTPRPRCRHMQKHWIRRVKTKKKNLHLVREQKTNSKTHEEKKNYDGQPTKSTIVGIQTRRKNNNLKIT